MAGPPRSPIHASRKRVVLALVCLLLGLLAMTGSAMPVGKALPFTLRPGDVVANAPLGVLRERSSAESRLVLSAAVGVRRPLPPPSPVERIVVGAPVGVLRGAGVASLSPGRVALGTTGQSLELRGHGLQRATTIRFEPAEGVTTTALQIAPSGDVLSLSIDVDAAATTGYRRVRLLDAGGRSLPVLNPAAGQLLFAAAPPHIDSIAPSVLRPGQAATLLIRGRHLRGLPSAKSDPNQPIVRLLPGDGIDVGNAPTYNADGTEVAVPIRIDESAAVGVRRVEVETLSGVSDPTPSAANSLSIVAETLTDRGPFVSPRLGVRRGDTQPAVERFSAAPLIGVVRGPYIARLQPDAVELDSRITLRIEGRGLAGTTAVLLAPDSGISQQGGTLEATDTAVEIGIDVAADAALFARRVELELASGRRLRAPDLLRVRDAEPVITALVPSFLLRNGLSQSIDIQGTALTQTSAVSLLPDTGLIIESYQVLDAGNARMVLRASGDSPNGARVVQVRAPGASSSADPTPGNTLYVRDAAQIVAPVVSPLLGVRRGVPPLPTRALFQLSPTLGVLRGAYAAGLQPALARRGISTRVRIDGRGLGGVQQVMIEPADGLSLSGLVAEAGGAALEFDLNVAGDVLPGMRRVRLIGSSGDLAFAPRERGQLQIADNSADVPEGRTDRYTLDVNGRIDVPLQQGVLGNDIDPQGNGLITVMRRLPATGTLDLRADGSFSYVPAADYVGSERFEYSPASGSAVGNSTVVTLVVAERDDAVDDSYLTPDNRALEVAAAQGLLSNDRIAQGAVEVLVEVASQPTLGSITVQHDGSFRYQPSGSPGNDAFTYRLRVDGRRSLPATVRIAVQSINDAPLAADDAYVTDRGARLDIPRLRGVLANDSDPDGDTMQARVVSAPAEGALSLALDGSFSYTPPTGFVGATSFRYEAIDGRGGRAEAEVRITVNDTLAAADDRYTMNEGEVLFVDETNGVLANDSVFPQGTLRVVTVAAPTRGTLQLANDGSFVYTPSDPDFSGSDSFTYRLQDDRASSPTAQVSITINGVNDPPVGSADRYLTDENAQLAVAAPGVLGNDRDIEDNTLRAAVARPPGHGTLTLREDGSFTYVPEVNYRGTDSFEYAPGDGSSLGSPVLVEIAVTQPPTATNDVYLVDIDTPIAIDDPDLGLLVNDHDAPENDDLVALIDRLPQNGELILAEDGTFRYTPDPGYTGLDVWTYQVSDGRSESNVGTVTMAVGITSLPRAVPDAYTTTEDTELIVTAADGLLANDTDADTPRERLEAYLVGGDLRNLSITVNRDGSFRVRPAANYVGQTFFIYQIYDGTDISNGARVDIRVEAVNDGVDAEDDAYGVLRNTVLDTQSGSVRSIRYNDRYDPDFAIRFELVEPPTAGTATIDANSGRLLYTPGQDFAGTDQLRYRVTQIATGINDSAVVRLRINAPPQAVNDAYAVSEDQLTTVSPSPLANDTDVDGDPLSLLGTEFWYYLHGYNVRLRVDSAQQPTLTDILTQNNFYGTATISYRISDGTQDDTGEIVVQVSPVPDAPVVAADSYLTQRDTPLAISALSQGVLNNDFDPDTRASAGAAVWPAASGVDLQPLEVELLQTVANGQLTLNANGTFYYVPNSGYSGVDSFRYRARDATGRYSGEATASIRVNSPARAEDDAYVVTEDVPLVVAAADGLLINDTDIDGDPLRADFAGSGCAPCNGRVQISADGSFRYTPNRDFHGVDEFFYRVRDGVNGSDTGRVAITVTPVNDPPITDSDTYRTREDEVLVAPEPQGVLRNDREVDGDGLDFAELIEEAAHGSVAFEDDGSFTYTPEVNFHGEDGFRYRVYDTTGLSTEAQVEVFVTPVNDPPSAAEDRYTTRKDQELVVAAADGVLANDTDVDGPAMRVSLIGPPQHGQLTLAGDGGFRYRPNGFFSGVDQFRYQVDDGLGALATGVALIQVTAVDTPVTVVAENDFYRFTGPRLEVEAPGVLGNDRVEGAARDTLRAEIAVAPERGSLALAADGSFLFQAPDGYSGLLGFTYVLRSGDASAIARVNLDVQAAENVPPQARGEAYGVFEDGELDSRRTFSLLANDSDFEGDALQLDVLAEPENGSLQWLGDGHFLYRPAADFHGSERIRYRVGDGRGHSLETEASITVFAQNDAPLALDDIYRVPQDAELQVPTASGVLANDRDPDGDPLLVELVDAPAKGQLSMDPEGGFLYRPLPGASGEDSFRYAASDLADLATATVKLNVARDNRPPVAAADEYRIDEDTVLDSRVAGSPLANDVDPDGDALSLRVLTEPAHGQLVVEGGEFRYLPARDFAGRDGFRYVASDGEFDSAETAVGITVAAIDDAPVTEADQYSLLQDTALDIVAAAGVLANDRDAEGLSLAATLERAPSHGELVLQADGGFRYRPRSGYRGRDEFAYRASDGVNASVGRVVIDILPAANARPLAQGERYTLAEDSVLDTRVFSSLLANDRDPEGQPLQLVVKDVPSYGRMEWLDGGHLRYTPPRDHVAPVLIRYAVSDGVLDSQDVVAEIVYLAQNDAPEARADVYRMLPAADRLEIAPRQGVLANDRDPDADTLVCTVLEAPGSGTVKLNLDGSFLYLPAQPRPAEARFRYRVVDAAGASSDAEVLLLLSPQTAQPQVFHDSFESPR